MLFLPITLNCLPVQSLHNSTANFRAQATVTFLVNGDERPLLIECFLKHLEMSPFHWRWFFMCATNRLGHAFPWTRNLFTNSALIPKIYLACSFADATFPSGNFRETFFCFMSFAHAQSTSESKSAYFRLSRMCTASQSGFGKFRYKSFSYPLEKSERPSFCVVVSWTREFVNFERLSVIP